MTSAEKMSTVFGEVEPMLWSIVRNCKRAYCQNQSSAEDLFGVACIYFTKAFHSFDDAASSSLRTWIYNKVLWGIKSHVRYEQHKTSHTIQTDYEEPVSLRRFSIAEFVDELTEDARAIVKLVLDTPAELARLMRAETITSSHVAQQRGVSRYLIDTCGWSISRVEKSFDEITVQLN